VTEHAETFSSALRPIVFGADWCEDTRRARRHLRRLSVAHTYINIDEDLAGLERAKALNAGHRRTPVIDLDGFVLVEPTNAALTEALLARELLSAEEASTQLAVQNVGDVERAVRAGSGLLLTAIAQAAPRPLRWPLSLAGAALALTGLVGWCPVFHARGITSLNGPADRPAEASREAWLAPRELEAAR
jgi:glutaredoxin